MARLCPFDRPRRRLARGRRGGHLGPRRTLLRAAASALDLPATDRAARIVRQLVGPAVVDHDYWRDRSVSLPHFVVDGEVDEQHDRAEHRYQRFFAAGPRVLATLAELLR